MATTLSVAAGPSTIRSEGVLLLPFCLSAARRSLRLITSKPRNGEQRVRLTFGPATLHPADYGGIALQVANRSGSEPLLVQPCYERWLVLVYLNHRDHGPSHHLADGQDCRQRTL